MRLLSLSSRSKKKPSKGKPTARRQRPAPAWRAQAVRLAAAAGLVVATGAAIGWSVQSGLVARTWDTAKLGATRLTADAGLRIEDVLVAGRSQTRPDALLEAIGVRRGTPILTVDLAATRARVLDLPWVKDAQVERRLPDTLHVTLAERRPMALWQRGGEFTLVDEDGVEIADQDVRRFHNLPILIGKDAPARAAAALAMLGTEPDLGARVQALTWVGGRRWTVRLDNGMDVQLPEINPDQAWTHLATLAREHNVLERDVMTIDLRIPDQLIMRMTPAAHDRATAAGKDT
jgi:cell division protein FtsQ